MHHEPTDESETLALDAWEAGLRIGSISPKRHKLNPLDASAWLDAFDRGMEMAWRKGVPEPQSEPFALGFASAIMLSGGGGEDRVGSN
jgi:hypothetical protein